MVMAVVVILISAGASFFFALAEAALLSLNKWQARQLAERHPRAGARVARLLEQPQDLLATMAFGNTFANAAMLAVALQMVFDDRWPFLWTMALLLALILIGCEVLPKTLAVRQPERWAQRVGGPLLLFQRFTTPLRYVAQKMNEAILKLAAPQFIRPAAVLTDGEYHELLEMAYQQGTLAGSEK